MIILKKGDHLFNGDLKFLIAFVVSVIFVMTIIYLTRRKEK